MGLLSSMTNGLIGLPKTKHECDVRIGELEKKLLGFSLGKIIGVKSDEDIKKEIKRLKSHKKTLSKLVESAERVTFTPCKGYEYTRNERRMISNWN